MSFVLLLSLFAFITMGPSQVVPISCGVQLVEVGGVASTEPLATCNPSDKCFPLLKYPLFDKDCPQNTICCTVLGSTEVGPISCGVQPVRPGGVVSTKPFATCNPADKCPALLKYPLFDDECPQNQICCSTFD